MATHVRDIMSKDPVTLRREIRIREAAREMRDRGIGAVLVSDDSGVCGIVTDRDVVTRGIANGNDVDRITLGDICTASPKSISADASSHEAIKMMRDSAVRRLPVRDGEDIIGIVALGDLAVAHDPSSLLGDISAQPPNN